MSTAMSTKKGTADKRIQAVSDCGTRVLNLLRARSAISDALRLEVESHIQHMPSVPLLAEKAGSLDNLGTDLWNASASLVHQDDHQPIQHPGGQLVDCVRLGMTVRVFAFLLLDMAYISIGKHVSDEAGKVRIVKTAFKASRLCLETMAPDYALKILERCAEYVVLPETDTESSLPPESEGKVQAVDDALQTEYCLLRIMCAWRSDRLDTAHHFYLRLCSTRFVQNQILVQEAADLFWCISKASQINITIEGSILWLERGLAALSACDVDVLDDDTAELRLNITSDLVQRLLPDGDLTKIKRASLLVDELESQFHWRNRVTVQVLKFQVLTSTSPFDVSQVDRTLTRVIRMVMLTDSNFQMVMQMIGKVSKFSLPTSLTATSLLIRTRLLPEMSDPDHEDKSSKTWLCKALLVFIHLLTSHGDLAASTALAELERLLDLVFQCVGNVLTLAAVHACQALIWKVMQNAESNDALKYCGMLQHQLFDGASAENKARISRKSILIALDVGNITLARRAFDQTMDEVRNEPFTRYLAFKIALRSQDLVLARESLKFIAENVDKGSTYLFACVADAQQSASREVARLTLQALLVQRPTGIVLPSLLRAVAHLLISEIDNATGEADELVSDVVEISETAANEVFDAIDAQTNDHLPIEIEWWTKSTYNLIIRIFTRVKTLTIVRALRVCRRFFDHYSKISTSIPDGIQSHRMVCDFLFATAMVAVGRSDDTTPKDKLQAYRETRSHVKSYMTIRTRMVHTQQDSLEGKRTLEMLKYDLESILKSEEWESVDSALRSCLNLQQVERWGTLADLLVILHEHMNRFSQDSNAGRLLTEVLQKIINDTWRHDKDIVKVARWVRWTFSICLADRQSNFSFKLLEQAASMAANGHDGKHDRYPEAELHWLASSSFNRAIDLISHGDADTAEPWMDGALELARWAQDNGSLYEVLVRKRDVARTRSVQGDKGMAAPTGS